MPQPIGPLRAWCSHLLLVVIGITMLLPFMWMVATSLKGEAEVFQHTLLPTAVTLGEEGDALLTRDGHPLQAAEGLPDGGWSRGAALHVRRGSPMQQGGKGDRARLPDGTALTDDLGLPVALGNLTFDARLLASLGGQARMRDPRVFDRFAEPVLIATDFTAPGFSAADNAAAAEAWFCRGPGRYRAPGAWAALVRTRFGGRQPLMLTPALADAWATFSGKALPLTIVGVPLINHHPQPTSSFYQFKNVSWGRPGEPVRDKTLPAVLCQDDGVAVRFTPAFPVFRTVDDPLQDAAGRDLLAFVGDESEPRTVRGGELRLTRRLRLMWSNYQTVLTDPQIKLTLFAWNSLFIAVAVVALQVLTSSLAAFAFSRLTWPGRDWMFAAYLGTLMIPGAITMIPNYLILQQLGGLNSFWGLIVPGAASAYGTFMLRQFMLTLPKGLEEAAAIDGAGPLRVWWDIVMPLSKPAVITLAIFTFAGTWSSFTWPLIVGPDEAVRVLPVALAGFSAAQSTSYTLLMAASLIALSPMLILFIVGQKYFVAGIQLGGVKG